MKPFKKNDFPTLGVEEEFHLINQQTGELSPRIDDVMAGIGPEMRAKLCYELLLCVLENRTGVYRTVDELVAGVCEGRRRIAACCNDLGVSIVAAGCHPFGDWRNQPFVDDEHYRWVRDNHKYIAHRLLAFGLHIHVGVQSQDAAIYIMNQMQRWVYPLLALSANSPYYEGMETGLVSTRTHLFTCMPRSNLPPYFKNFNELVAYYEKLLAAGDVTRPGDLWWNIRPQPPLGTVEIRIFDMPTDVRHLGALAAITQAALATYQDAFRAGEPESILDHKYLEQNRWRTMRDGLNAVIIEPATGEIVTVRSQLERLFDQISAKAQELHAGHHLDFARKVLISGNEAEQQLTLCQSLNGNLQALELELARQTLNFHGLDK